MGLLGELYEGRKVIGWSGHKSEAMVKQYVRKLSTKTKREMRGHLANEMMHKVPKMDTQQKYHFKAIPSATVSKPPEDQPVQQAQAENAAPQPEPVVEFQIEPFDDAPSDDVLINFLNAFEMPQNNPVQNDLQNAPLPHQPTVPNVLQPVATNNNTMNIQNVKNVAPNQAVPAMYFPNSNVTINYHFNK